MKTSLRLLLGHLFSLVSYSGGKLVGVKCILRVDQEIFLVIIITIPIPSTTSGSSLRLMWLIYDVPHLP